MSHIPHEQLHPNDKNITRNRTGRQTVLISYVLGVLAVCSLAGGQIFSDWFGLWILGFFIGLVGAVFILGATLPKFFIRVELVSAFVTVDLVNTVITGRSRDISERELPESGLSATEAARREKEQKKQDSITFPTYGPGLHIAYPWEQRDPDYNFSLQEVSADMEFPILLQDGTVTLKGSYRLRPDFDNLIPFLSGVASTAEELEEIITAFAIEKLNEMTVDQALGSLQKLNEELMVEFGLGKDEQGHDAKPKDKVSEFERRFGVYVGDITIAEILPSKEVQRTRGSITEARAIQEGTAIILGYKNADELRVAMDANRVKQDDVRHARDRFLSISGNMEGMELKRHEIEFMFPGLDKEAITALSEAAKAFAPAITAAMAARNKPTPKKK